jgi:subtilisin family serine protease
VIAAVALLVPLAAPSPAGATPHPVPLEQIVVKLASGGVRASSVLTPFTDTALAAPADRYVMTLSAGEVGPALAKLNANPRVAFADRVRTVRAATTPNDPCFADTGSCAPDGGASPNQPNLRAVNAPAAWSVTQGSPNLTVAVLDTGVDSGHPDLAGKVVQPGKVFCTTPNELCAPGVDLVGHGTHVSGIIAAATNNSLGIAGLGWNTKVFMYKVLEDPNPNQGDPEGGEGSSADIASAIYDATNSGFRVINMSLSNEPCSANVFNCGPDQDTQAAVAYAIDHGVVVVAAAGNGDETPDGGSTDPTFPAGYPGVISVAATGNDRVVAGFSEYGSAANLAAPGVGVLSTWNDGNYADDTGTSMAAPEVAAAAALVMARFPTLSGPQVATQLHNTAAPLGPGRPIDGGFLDVNAAVTTPPTLGIDGYQLAGADGGVYNFGAATNEGTVQGQPLVRPVVGIAPTPDRLGYWLAAADGGLFAFGDAAFFGSIGGHPLNQPVVGMAPTTTGKGYWEVAADGGIFAFGDGGFYGSTGGIRLARPVVGIARTPDNRGYWLVASDGGIFAFGDAGFFGSTGAVALARPIVGMAATPSGRGYWLVASDGGIFAFGDAVFYGSTGADALSSPIVGMAATPSGHGYWLVASDGGIFAFGDAGFYGSLGGEPLPAPIVGAAS